MEIDLRTATFEDFVRLVFDHPVEQGNEHLISWYYDDDVELVVDPSRQVTHLTTLFQFAAALPERFTPEQLEQGFWFIFGSTGDYFTKFFWSPALSWAARRAAVLSVAELYRDLFDWYPLPEIDFMIPDLLADRYDHGTHAPKRNVEDRRVQDALMEAFSRMLTLSSARCQHAALHGFGHLRHPEGPSIIQAYLDAHPGLDPELAAYAAEAMTGDVL